MRPVLRTLLPALVLALLLVLAASAPAQTPPAAAVAKPATPAAPAASAPAPKPPFAVVGDVVITAADYQRALAVAMRKKYYHAKPPEEELPKFQREVGDDIVNRILLLAEARRRGIQPDAEKIKATVAGYEQQYRGSASWQANKDRMLAAVVPQLESESLLDRLEKLVRLVPEPAEPVARAFYEQNKALFVEPEQVKLSVILLKVDPSSRQSVWTGAMEEAKALHKRLAAGADFKEAARLRSGDRSAANGGEMDYTHRGMLPEAVHGVVDKMQPGQMSEPVQLLEGIAILRLEGRKPATQRSFEQVKVRAADLWQRQEGEARWKKLIAELRQGTPVRIDESQYAPLRAARSS
ncbi:MAG: peptidyl-prolyl cis-trans isomerase [Rubrivivax sp.]|nr:peptidyl-prolyl cis-trans isomerase [Rubrivivax sp.]